MSNRLPRVTPTVERATPPPSECPGDNTIARVLDGGLGPDERASLERHLDMCSECLALVAGAGEHRPDLTAQGDRPSAECLAVGSRVGRYILRAPIGAGAMGRVYVAHDPTLDRKVALKLLHRSVIDPALEARLLREAKAMARLPHHPDVVTVYDAGTHESRVFIAMELVEGGTLREWVASRRRPWRETLAIFVRAGRGLAHAHAGGLVHRDFKPDNVLVGFDGRVRVTDFGLARATRDVNESATGTDQAWLDTSLSRSGMLVGTPAYMSPEQLNGRAADARSDIFGFCVALYEGLYGVRPFPGSSVVQLRESASRDRPTPPPRSHSVPRRVWRAVASGLRASPEDRRASMTSLLDSLEEAARPSTLRIAGGAFAGVVAVTGLLLASRGGASETPRPAAATAVTQAPPRAPSVSSTASDVAAKSIVTTFGPPTPPESVVRLDAISAPKRRLRARAPTLVAEPVTDSSATVTTTTHDEDAVPRIVLGNNGAPIFR